jgi:hypothetical protein
VPVIILYTSYDKHLRRKHPNLRRLSPQEKRDDIVFHQQQQGLRRSKRIAGREEANAAHEFEENNGESGENSSADEKESDLESPEGSSRSNSEAASSDEDEGEIHEIIGHEDIRGVRYYLIHWQGYPREEATKILGSWISGTIGRVNMDIPCIINSVQRMMHDYDRNLLENDAAPAIPPVPDSPARAHDDGWNKHMSFHFFCKSCHHSNCSAQSWWVGYTYKYCFLPQAQINLKAI